MMSDLDPYRTGYPTQPGISRAHFAGIEIFREHDEGEAQFLARVLLAARASGCAFFDVAGSIPTDEAAA